MLYLSSGSVAPALELLRRICQPESRSLPHITARYSSMQVRPEALEHYSNALVDDLILADVSTFDEMSDGDLSLQTVIIKCESEDLEWLSYKPDFPDSVFHFTIYDGPKSAFAFRVYEVMQSFAWDLRLVGASERVEPYDKARSVAQREDRPSLTPGARSLLHDLAGRAGIKASLTEMTNADRLRLVHAVCEHIHQSPEVEVAGYHPMDLETERVSRYAGQDQRWTHSTIDELSPSVVSLPDERESAMFLTPPELAYDIAEAAVNLLPQSSTIDFGDPSIGPGIFFAALRQVVRPDSVRSAVGVEINPERARSTAQRWRRAGLKVVVGDFLTRRPVDRKWNLLLANPPYVRHQDIDRPMAWMRDALFERTGIRIDGRSDLYMYFILSAHDWLQEQGIAAWLLPSELVSTDFGKALRSYLTTKVTLRRLHTYDRDSPRFDNARVSSSVLIYEKAIPSPNNLVLVTRGGTLAEPAESMSLSMSALQRSAKWNWSALKAPTTDLRPRIGDFFDVKRGIATGANSHFVLSDEDISRLEIHSDWIRPVLPKSRKLASTVVHADDEGNPIEIERRWLIDTDEPLDSIERASPVFAEYLRRVNREVGSRTLVSQRRPFYRQEKREVPDFVFIYMAKEDVDGERRFIWNRSRAVVLNSYLAMTLKPEYRAALNAGLMDWESLFHALRAVSSEEFSRHGRSYISGLLKLEPAELRQIRLDLSPNLLNTIV
ncbi:Eco57I restriction-modification methylase domain-containing protein [Microbacterium kunmingense]|uniref:Eco57I restriction-modification methylase domain-containing protein n=1 Tax=Microbacterium kunmingense TaxID=2915939 RepID=UPI003D7439FC